MKVAEILEADAKKPKPRPKSNLWFRDARWWVNDLKREHGEVAYHEDEEQNLFATDPEDKICYGYWNNKKNGGMTFHEPKPFDQYNHKKRVMIRREM